MVSKKDLNKAELETLRISKNPILVVTANGEVQRKEEATVHVRELDFSVTVVLLGTYSRSSFTWKTLRRIWVQLSLEQWSETTSHPKWQEFIATRQFMYHSSCLVAYQRVLLSDLLLLHLHCRKL